MRLKRWAGISMRGKEEEFHMEGLALQRHRIIRWPGRPGKGKLSGISWASSVERAGVWLTA